MTRSAYLVLTCAVSFAACTSGNPNERITGQTDFVSAPMAGASRGEGASGGATGGRRRVGGARAQRARRHIDDTPTVEETDIYRLEGNRLYYLNGYRGLMVFDVADVDTRSSSGARRSTARPSRCSCATASPSWWSATGTATRTTARRSTAPSSAASTPPIRANIRSLGEAKLGGWVRDMRVVGDDLYAVSEDYGWRYGWRRLRRRRRRSGSTGVGSTTRRSRRSSSRPSASAAARIQPVGTGVPRLRRRVQRHAQRDPVGARQPRATARNGRAPTSTELLDYIDISRSRGRDRAARHASGRRPGQRLGRRQRPLEPRLRRRQDRAVVGCAAGSYGCSGQGGYVLATVDFTNPDAPHARVQARHPVDRLVRRPRASTTTACTSRRARLLRRNGTADRHAVPGLRL